MFRFLMRRKIMWALAALALGSSAAFAAGRGGGPGGGPGCGGGEGCGGGCAHRGGPGARGEFFKARMDAHVADLVDLTKATPEQKKALEAARDRMTARMQAHRGPGPQAQGPGQGQGRGQGQGKGAGQDRRAAHHREMQALFQADNPDPKKIEALRDQHLQHRGEMALGMVDELGQLHGVFNRDQRKAMAGYLQELGPGQHGQWRERMGHFMMGRMVGHFSDQVKATPEQKKALTALAEKAGEAIKTQRQARQQLAEKALALWQGERWDPAQVQSLQKAQQDLAKTGADTAIRYGLEAHKLLTPAQRKAAAEFMGQRGMHGRGHGGHGFGGFGGPPEDGE